VLMLAIEDAKPEDAQQIETHSTPAHTKKVLIEDAMEILYCMKKTPKIRTLKDLQVQFVKNIEKVLEGCDEGRICFDRYLDLSLKNKTRKARSKSSTEYVLHPEMKLAMSIKDLLSSTKTKRELTKMFAQALLEHFATKSTRVFVIYDNKIVGPDTSVEHTHEEADTIIPHQVLASAAEDEYKEITVRSPDTDVEVYLCDLVANDHITDKTSLLFHTGKGKGRIIDINERVQVLRQAKCQALIGFHNFTGADWGGKFVGKTKESWTKAFMKLKHDDPVLQCFKKLGEGSIKCGLENGKLPQEFTPLEEFVCKVYNPSRPLSLPELRWELFRSRNLEGEMLPPTRASLLPHIIRVNFVSMIGKSYTSACPNIPQIEENGWTIEDNMYVPTKCLICLHPKLSLNLPSVAARYHAQGTAGAPRTTFHAHHYASALQWGAQMRMVHHEVRTVILRIMNRTKRHHMRCETWYVALYIAFGLKCCSLFNSETNDILHNYVIIIFKLS
jgi:hypothetical protein